MEPIMIQQSFDRKRSAPSFETSDDTKRSKTMMIHTSRRAPIVLFATRDRERTANDQSFREMLGYDDDSNNKDDKEDASSASSSFTIDSIVLGNYRMDFEFLLHEVPELLTVPQVTLFYGHDESHAEYLEQWKQATTCAQSFALFDSVRSACYRRHDTNNQDTTAHHHMLRVIIHTANLLERDIHCKIQGAYIQDFPQKVPNATGSLFEDDLVAYLDTYNYTQPRIWSSSSTPTSPCSLTQWLRQYDFSSATVALLSSTPGYHRLTHHDPDQSHRALQGHLRISQLIRQHCKSGNDAKQSSGPVVCQFSSMGSLTEKYLEELHQSMNVISARRPKDERPSATKSSKAKVLPLQQRLQLVYPTVEQIRESYEGYAGGGSVPGPFRNVNKAFLRPLYHQWSNDGRKHVGHIKTYYQLSGNEQDTMEWFVLTSHNLSKAAWGEVQNRAAGRRLFVRHWELGVWLCPPQGDDSTPLAPFGTELPNAMTVPLPYPVRPVPYRANDQPWAVDGVYERPDAFGRVQRPFST